MSSNPALRSDPNASSRATRAEHLRFGVLCVLAYVALAWAVRVDLGFGPQMASLVYPLDTFSMYAGAPGEYVSHLLVRDGQGTFHRVTAFRAFECAEPVARDAARCVDATAYAYLYDDLATYIEQHRGRGDIPVELVYRTWRVRSGTAPTPVSDCVVAHCTVSR